MEGHRGLMGSYTVKAVKGDPRQWDGPKGTVLYYKLELEGIPELAEIGQKPETAAPQPGQVIEGNLSDPDPQYGTRKLKKTFNAGGGGKGWQPPSPEEVAAMRRSGAQNRAVATLDVCQKMGMLDGLAPEGKVNRDGLTATLLFLTDFFDGDVAAAAERAKA